MNTTYDCAKWIAIACVSDGYGRLFRYSLNQAEQQQQTTERREKKRLTHSISFGALHEPVHLMM